MQPRLVAALQAAASVLRSPLTLLHTHASGLLNPTGNIDCSCMASATCKAWTQLVHAMEFKLQDRQESSLIGEIVRRCRVTLNQQPTRQWGLATGFSLTSVQFFRFTRGSHDQLQLSRSGWQPLHISGQDPGWKKLAAALAASPAQQGHVIPALPSQTQIGTMSITQATLMHESVPKQGQGGSASLVYKCTGSDGQPAVLKLVHAVGGETREVGSQL